MCPTVRYFRVCERDERDVSSADSDPGRPEKRRESRGATNPRQTFPSSPNAERGGGRPGGRALGRCGPFVKRRHLHKVGPLPFCALPQPPGPRSLRVNGPFKFSPKNEVEPGIRKKRGKKIFVGDFFSLLVLGSL